MFVEWLGDARHDVSGQSWALALAIQFPIPWEKTGYGGRVVGSFSGRHWGTFHTSWAVTGLHPNSGPWLERIRNSPSESWSLWDRAVGSCGYHAWLSFSQDTVCNEHMDLGVSLMRLRSHGLQLTLQLFKNRPHPFLNGVPTVRRFLLESHG